MTLTLTIENFAALPDGGPLSVSLSGRRGIDIGRDQYLDWSLPDPDRVISGKHAEVRYRDGCYWLKDVSRNGTFLNRNPQRLQEACRLRDGDRIEIGRYVIVVRLEGEAPPAAPSAATQEEAPENYWNPADGAAPPLPSRDFKPPSALRPVKPDFADWSVDIPVDLSARPAPASEEVDWARSRPPMPTPRRPAERVSAAWGEPPTPAESLTPEGFPPAARDDPWKVSSACAHEMRSPTLGDQEASRPASANDAFIQGLAAGLGIAPEILSWRDPGDLAEEVGVLLRLCAENLKQLLAARAETKRTTRTANQTTIQAIDNNPLKFAPTLDDALRIMLGRPSSGYLSVRPAMEAGFRDLKTHQIKTYAAMQNALRLLLDDLSPEGIEASDEKDRGLSGLLGSRKARLWDIYTTRWDALASSHDDGMIDAFMVFFSDCYDKSR